MSKSRNVVMAGVVALGGAVFAARACNDAEHMGSAAARMDASAEVGDREPSLEIGNSRNEVKGKVMTLTLDFGGGGNAGEDLAEHRTEANKATWLALACNVDPDAKDLATCLREHGVNPDIAAKRMAEVAKADVDDALLWHLGMLKKGLKSGSTDEETADSIEEDFGITQEFESIVGHVSAIKVAMAKLSDDSIPSRFKRGYAVDIADRYVNVMAEIEAGDDDKTEAINALAKGMEMSLQGLAKNMETIAELLGGERRNEQAAKLIKFAEKVRSYLE